MKAPYALRPSAAHIWAKCSGYTALSSLYPELAGQVDDTVREEGNAGHWVAHMMGQGFIVVEGTIAPNGLEVTDEMIEGAEMFLAELRRWDCPVYQETPLPAPWIHAECGGTPDAWGYNKPLHRLRVGDYKFGYRFVDPFENWQCAIYASAIVDALKLHDPDLIIEIMICQPRAFGSAPIRTWETTLGKLRELLNWLHTRAVAALEPGAPCTPGDYCDDCSGRHACVALQRSSLHALDISARSVPNELSPAAAADALRRLEHAETLLHAMRTGLQSQLQHHLTNGGESVPFYQIGHGQSRTVWREGVDAQVLAMGKLLGADLAKPLKPITPRQAEKLVPADIVAKFSERRAGRAKLIATNDKQTRKLLEQKNV